MKQYLIPYLQPISFRRYSHSTGTGTVCAMYTDKRPDIINSALPLSFNVAVYNLVNGGNSPVRSSSFLRFCTNNHEGNAYSVGSRFL